MTELPAFHIVVSEELIDDHLNWVHRMGINTIRICKDLDPEIAMTESILKEKLKIALVDEESPKSYYTKIAIKLSTLDNQQLLDHFSCIRVSHKLTRSEKKYQFKFDY
jgi:hypothetical protein